MRFAYCSPNGNRRQCFSSREPGRDAGIDSFDSNLANQRHPGKYDLHGDTTVLQAIANGGGFTEAAKHSHVRLFRQISDDWVQTRKLDLKKMRNSGNLSEDLHLRPKSALAKMKPFIPLVTVGTYIPMH